MPEQLSVTGLAEAIRSRGLSPTAVVEDCLTRIARLDPTLRAWVQVDAAGARETARALETEARAGQFRGPLHGVPVALKDIFDVAGMVTTSGAAPFAHRTAEHDAPSVATLRRAGAVIIGKTTTTQFAFADPAQTRNPWNLDHTPGGSSAGSAAAVAAGMVPAALGSQTIGSTLRPAAYCGIVGMKPTYGWISTEGVTPLSWSLDHVGIFARSVDDAALVYSVMAGSASAHPPRGGTPRLGIPWRFIEGVTAREVKDHLRAIAAEFARAGARVEEVSFPPSAETIDEVGRVVLRTEAAAYHSAWFSRHAASYEPRIRELVESGMNVRGVDYALAQRARQRFRDEMASVLARVDALLTPAAPAPAPPLSLGTTGDPVLCAPWSFGGFPAIALPSGLSVDRLPLAIQLVAGMNAEPQLIDAARWCESRLGFTQEPPLG